MLVFNGMSLFPEPAYAGSLAYQMMNLLIFHKHVEMDFKYLFLFNINNR